MNNSSRSFTGQPQQRTAVMPALLGGMDDYDLMRCQYVALPAWYGLSIAIIIYVPIVFSLCGEQLADLAPPPPQFSEVCGHALKRDMQRLAFKADALRPRRQKLRRQIANTNPVGFGQRH